MAIPGFLCGLACFLRPAGTGVVGAGWGEGVGGRRGREEEGVTSMVGGVG